MASFLANVIFDDLFQNEVKKLMTGFVLSKTKKVHANLHLVRSALARGDGSSSLGTYDARTEH